MAYRTVHVEGTAYEYVVGRSAVNVKLPGGGTLRTTPWAVKGTDPSIVERGRWKRTSDGMVTPGEVAEWIRVTHLGLPPAARPSPVDPGPVPDGGPGAHWIRFRGVGRRVAALWSREGGWTLAGDGSPLPGSGIEEVLGPVEAPRADLWHVTAWRNDEEGGIRRVTVGIFTDPGPAKAAQIAILERVADELEPLLGRRPRPLDAPRAAHGAGLDGVWHVEIEPVTADAVLVDVMAESPYRDAEPARRMVPGRPRGA